MKTSQKFLLIDESAAKEILNVLGKEFIHHENERVHRLLGLCARLVHSEHVASRDDLFGHIVRNDVEPSIRDSVRIVHLSSRSGNYIVEKL